MSASSPSSRIPRSSRLLVIFSDIEMGTGGVEDDFPHSDFLGELIGSYDDGPQAGLDVDLVFNGDTFDLLKTDHEGRYPRHISRAVALSKMARIAAAHPAFFAAVRRFVEGDPGRRVFFVTGNHDAELLFPEVQRQIQSLCGEPARVVFPGLSLQLGRVRIEHGAQADPLFQVDARRPLVLYQGEEVLNISWGAAALLDTVMPLRSLLYFLDRLRPKNGVFQIMPEVRELLMGKMWSYWTRDYWQGWLSSGDPTKKLTWSMVKEVVSRLRSHDLEVPIAAELERRLVASEDLLHVVGHAHEPVWRRIGGQKLLQTGCLRNEYLIEQAGRVLRPMPKTYAEVYLRDDRPVVSQLVEVEGPEPPPGYLPGSIFDVLPRVRELLGSEADRAEQRAAQQDQERQEQRATAEPRRE